MSTQSTTFTPVDLDSIKKKLQQLNSSNKRQSMTWKAPIGESTIRIVPYKHAKDPFNELLFHYDVGNRTALCAANFAKECPICNFAQKLRAKKTEEDFNAFKKIAAKTRVYIPILVRGKEDEGIKFWGVGKEVYETLLNFFTNPEYGDITHPIDGTDIVVKFTGKSDKLLYGKTEVFPKRNSSPLHQDKAMIVKLLKEVPNIFEVYPEQSFTELEQVLNNYLNPPVEEQKKDSDVGTVITPAKEAISEKTEVITDLDKEFDDIFKKTS